MDGYAQRDFALRNAGWHVADFFAERREGDDRREGCLGKRSGVPTARCQGDRTDGEGRGEEEEEEEEEKKVLEVAKEAKAP